DEQLAQEQLRSLFREKLADFVKTLDERDEDILRNRLLSETPLTLDDLGAKYGITKERTRQLEARIIKRLRDHIKKDVKDFDRLRTYPARPFSTNNPGIFQSQSVMMLTS